MFLESFSCLKNLLVLIFENFRADFTTTIIEFFWTPFLVVYDTAPSSVCFHLVSSLRKYKEEMKVSTLVTTIDSAEQVLRCCWDFCQRLYIKEKIKRGQVKLQLPFYSISSHKKDTEFRERQSVNDIV